MHEPLVFSNLIGGDDKQPRVWIKPLLEKPNFTMLTITAEAPRG